MGKALGKVWQGPVEGEESLGRVREALWNLGRLWERLCGKLGRLCGKVYVCWTGGGGGCSVEGEILWGGQERPYGVEVESLWGGQERPYGVEGESLGQVGEAWGRGEGAGGKCVCGGGRGRGGGWGRSGIQCGRWGKLWG